MQLIEGGGVSQLRGIVKQLGYNKDVDIEMGTITAPLPNISVKLDEANFDLDAEDCDVCEHLREHEREVSINGQDTTITFKDALKVGDRVAVVMFGAGQRYLILDRI
ncbi:DUF2577 family protein [Paenibacillus xylanilyticus]|uniref:DUF2577 domain-containing protein n=1 Tax=Paenibacillus xylanilyticus TaxID=248903 RepID=A0A7Y6ETZ0_9BACL|nr:DUF2577 family protein [Paenibacillus xylanilyticus]NUU74243.1 DUF2577 domain-containing protein [Paenibacillus xylanilyticus]